MKKAEAKISFFEHSPAAVWEPEETLLVRHKAAQYIAKHAHCTVFLSKAHPSIRM